MIIVMLNLIQHPAGLWARWRPCRSQTVFWQGRCRIRYLLDSSARVCTGCGRTVQEIAEW
jgi:Protein of unknown function (DUF1289)